MSRPSACHTSAPPRCRAALLWAAPASSMRGVWDCHERAHAPVPGR